MYSTPTNYHNSLLQSEAENIHSAQVPVPNKIENTANKSREMSSSPQSSPRATPTPAVMSSIVGRPSEKSGNQVEEQKEAASPLSDTVNTKIVDLVQFLLLKYQRKELTSKAEMLDLVTRDCEEHYPVIFREASEYMKLFFGIDMVEVDPVVHHYVLDTALGITYDGMMQGPQDIPNMGFLTMALCIIFMEGNYVSEDKFWGVLNKFGLHAGRNHFIFGEPRKLLTEDFVKLGYLQYRKVPESDPPCHEFLWGPRAHAETTKMKVLKFFASVTKRDPQFYTENYAEALRDEGGGTA